MKVRNLIGAALLAACAVARAQAGEDGIWWKVAATMDGKTSYDIKTGSLITTPKGAAIVTTRVVDEDTHEIKFHLMGLRLQSCAEQQGQLTVFDLSGNKIVSMDFVLGGGSITSAVAEAICGMARSRTTHTRAPASDL